VVPGSNYRKNSQIHRQGSIVNHDHPAGADPLAAGVPDRDINKPFAQAVIDGQDPCRQIGGHKGSDYAGS